MRHALTIAAATGLALCLAACGNDLSGSSTSSESGGNDAKNETVQLEEQYFVHSGMNGPEHPLVRGDIIYFSAKNGGAMFSSSSMSWCACLSWNDYRNNVSQLTGNVLRRFATDGPLEEI